MGNSWLFRVVAILLKTDLAFSILHPTSIELSPLVIYDCTQVYIFVNSSNVNTIDVEVEMRDGVFTDDHQFSFINIDIQTILLTHPRYPRHKML